MWISMALWRVELFKTVWLGLTNTFISASKLAMELLSWSWTSQRRLTLWSTVLFCAFWSAGGLMIVGCRWSEQSIPRSLPQFYSMGCPEKNYVVVVGFTPHLLFDIAADLLKSMVNALFHKTNNFCFFYLFIWDNIDKGLVQTRLVVNRRSSEFRRNFHVIDSINLKASTVPQNSYFPFVVITQ